MSKVAVVYWSETGNTEIMAKCVAEGAKAQKAEVDLIVASDFSKENVTNYDAFAFGCSAKGDEELEESVFLPMWEAVSGEIADKKVVLFGSYGWGGGIWMEKWVEESPCTILETYICLETPGADEESACKSLGEKIA